jgi:two-component system, OmpR family, response regulator
MELFAREFALLETFMRRPGQVFTQTQLLEAAWDLGYEQWRTSWVCCGPG